MTPMMAQFIEIKKGYQDCIVFWRLGDFYEMFFEDAKIASKELGLALTGRECGMQERAPMCGVPHHAATTYINRLVNRGHSVAIVEQLTLPVKGKVGVERGVVKVITPGTTMEDGVIEASVNNFVASIYMEKCGLCGSISWCDISTGQFLAQEVKDGGFEDVLAMINPNEIISNLEYKRHNKNKNQALGKNISEEVDKESFTNTMRINTHFDYAFNPMMAHKTILDYFKIKDSKVFDFGIESLICPSSGALLEYINFTQKKNMPNISKIFVVRNDEILVLDKVARECLEITHQYRNPKEKKGTLLWVLDETKTSMGARMLSEMVTRPLCNIEKIKERHDAVELLFNNKSVCKDIREILGNVQDLSRLCASVANKTIMPTRMLALRESLSVIQGLKFGIGIFGDGLLKTCHDKLSPMPEITGLLVRAIACNPPTKLDEGGYIREGYNARLDELRELSKQGFSFISRLEEQERVETGFKELRIGYNRNIGYFIELPKRLSNAVPFRYERRATMTNAERYTTPELKELETRVLSASENALELELQILSEIRDVLYDKVDDIMQNSDQIAMIDVLASFATVAVSCGWIRPCINLDGKLNLRDARHPVVEKIIGLNKYIANNCDLQNSNAKVARLFPSTMLITGPNMAGKSTYMRSIAQCVLLAHIGSFVPCSNADISLTDRIFTRIGASDSMLTGQSTFMVECNEICVLLNNATKNSLLLLDEVGRGTGAQEGRALASAIITYITEKIGAKTLFATHFHELATLANNKPRIKNYRALTSIVDDQIVFLHKIEPGIEECSFGIDVAKLAGFPKEVLDNAKKLYEADKLNEPIPQKKITQPKEQSTINPIIAKLQDIDINQLSPMEAMITLSELIKEVRQ